MGGCGVGVGGGGEGDDGLKDADGAGWIGGAEAEALGGDGAGSGSEQAINAASNKQPAAEVFVSRAMRRGWDSGKPMVCTRLSPL